MEKWTNILQYIYEFFGRIVKSTKESLDKLKINTRTLADLLWIKRATEEKSEESDKTSNTETTPNNWNNVWESEWKKEETKTDKETSTENLGTEKLKSFFEKNATNLSIEKIDGKDFFEVSYTDKNSNSKVKGIIPSKWNWDSNIYMPGDRSGITETMNQKKFKQEITDKNSKKARFIFEWDADKINWNQKSARYNNVINNFENMISPIKSAGSNPKITIIWHSRAGRTVDSLIWRYWSISSYIILDWTYWWNYKNVQHSNIPGKIFYTNNGGTAKYISNYKGKPNLEISWEYAKLGHEEIVPKVLFDTPSTNQELFA